MRYQPNWDRNKRHFIDWWNRNGLLVQVTAPARRPREALTEPPRPSDLTQAWCDARYRVAAEVFRMSRCYYGGDAFPQFGPTLGPGSLGTLLGTEPVFEPDTVWYKPCVTDPDRHGPIRLDPRNNRWLDVHMAMIDEALRVADGRFRVGMPDLIENLDTLAAMRGSEELLMDLLERPEWVRRSLAEINQAFFAVFDLIFDRVKDSDGGNSFHFDIWGPGKTCKVQCDFSCMVSPAMFREFVVPPLREQCQWLDYSMYHLDGETALQHVDALLEIEPLDAIEWTPQFLAVGESGGDPKFYDLYRRIRSAGKGVNAVGVRPAEIQPLIDAVGPEGLYIWSWCESQDQAEQIERTIEQYRR